MSNNDEMKPILLRDSGAYAEQEPRIETITQQSLIIQPIEFDTRHRNYYGYLALIAFLLVLSNYLMIQQRTCQFPFIVGFGDYDLIQSFHLTTLIISIIIFVLSYFNFAVIIYEFKILFYTSATLIFLCAALMIYNIISIFTAPCVSAETPFTGMIQVFGAGAKDSKNVFSAHDGIGITVFIFDILAAACLFVAGRSFYKR